MRTKTNSVIHVGLYLGLLTCLVSTIGCGGGGAKANAGTAVPTPSPTPVPSSASLSATPSSLGFGTQALNTPTTQTVKVTNTGTVALAITQDTIAGSGFSAGVTTPINLNPAQSVNVPVVFNPGSAGTVNGSLTLVSNGATVLSVPLTGTGLAPLAHSVDVAWDPSSSVTLQGYNVYRSTVSGGPYTKISPTLATSSLLFTDTTPVSGKQYFYVVTAVDTNGAESSASIQVAVTIPVP
ncbi:MAG TPA: choice-of-anchor D domain-containing protein [Candidatus Polarisedimenticolia bacterium]|nr:choice-of-anchor D domain-containing protein [Candidatus Polarisedimenticolia bacterium]